MNFLAAEDFDDFLAELAEPDAGAGQFLVCADNAEHIAFCLWRVPAEQKIRRAQMKEAQRVALHELAEVHQPAQLVGGGRNVNRHDGVAGLRGRKRMAHWADAANALGDTRHFAVGSAFAEFLEAAKFHDVEDGVGNVALVVHENADLGVALDAGHGINNNAF